MLAMFLWKKSLIFVLDVQQNHVFDEDNHRGNKKNYPWNNQSDEDRRMPKEDYR